VHADALRRLDAARDHQRDTREALVESLGTDEEPAAESDLAHAKERAAAREAWLVWLERGF
jgi:hypothetical protein